MSKKPREKLVPYQFGNLPAAALNKALGLDLDQAEIHMSVNAQRHAQKRHPGDFARCFPHVASVIATPLYARDDFRNDGKIELVGMPAALGEFLLVAVEIRIDDDGRYNVASFYPLSQSKVDNRRQSGHLKRVIIEN